MLESELEPVLLKHTFKMASKRIVAYPSDIQLLTDKSIRQCQRIYNAIKKYLKKKKHQLLTIAEIAEYLGLPLSEVRATLGLD